MPPRRRTETFAPPPGDDAENLSSAELFDSLLEEARSHMEEDEALALIEETIEELRLAVDRDWPGTSLEAGFRRMILRLQLDEVARLAAHERAEAEARALDDAEFSEQLYQWGARERARYKGFFARIGIALDDLIRRVGRFVLRQPPPAFRLRPRRTVARTAKGARMN